MVSSQSTIDVSTSVVKYPWRIKGAVIGYSALYNKIRVLGGARLREISGETVTRGTLRVTSTNIVNDSLLYEDGQAPEGIPVSTGSEWTYEQRIPNVIADDGPTSAKSITDRYICIRQCSAQINNLLYIINPSLINDQGISLGDTDLMLVFDVDTQQYINQTQYGYNVPNANSYTPNDPGCVVTDGTLIFLIASLLSVPETRPVTCTVGATQCPISELYRYNPDTMLWTTRNELLPPSIPRYLVGCAMSPNNQDIYIFAGATIISPLFPSTTDFTAKQTEKYSIASNTWETLPSSADFTDSRWALSSFVSPTDNAIYLYGGWKYDPDEPVMGLREVLDASSMVVFDVETETILNLEDEQPAWNAGHSYLGLSNTIRIQGLCQNEIGISVGSSDFNMNRTLSELNDLQIDDVQILRFGEIYDNYVDNTITIEDVSSIPIEDRIWDAYGQHVFNFTVTSTDPNFIPNDDISNYDVNLTTWEGDTFNIAQLNNRRTGYRRRGNGRRPIISISTNSEDVNLFNKCNGVSNILARINVMITIRRQGRRNALCGQSNERRLSRWMFRDSDPDNDGMNEWTNAAIKLQVYNPSQIDNPGAVEEESDEYSLIHTCQIN